jgi:hypothetical protein
LGRAKNAKNSLAYYKNLSSFAHAGGWLERLFVGKKKKPPKGQVAVNA